MLVAYVLVRFLNSQNKQVRPINFIRARRRDKADHREQLYGHLRPL